MAIPDFQTVMLPLLEYFSDGKEHSLREIIDYISDQFELSEDERKELLPSGRQSIIDNRVGWARTYLKKAGLLDSTRRAYTMITSRGIEVLKQKPERIDVKFLGQFPEFTEFRELRRDSEVEKPESDEEIEGETPDELIEKGYNLIRAGVGQEILDKLRTNPPDFFESVVLDLLEAMGYGKGEVTGRSGDGGVDGYINQDKLGLDKIFFQAKRFAENNPVSASMIRDFVGTLESRGVSKGVFITTSKFPSNSENAIGRSQKSIIFVDGKKLVQLMIDHDVGVTTEKTYSLKRVDSDYFPED